MTDLYVKKLIPIEAYQWDGSVPFSPAPGFNPEMDQAPDMPSLCELKTGEGWMILMPKCWIAKDPLGEYWAIQDAQFRATYERFFPPCA